MHIAKLVFATNNPHKLEEARHILNADIRILSLQEIGCNEELPETHETLQENALEKASFLYARYKQSCFADDTGLEVDALNGAPGVYSARFAGPGKSYRDNYELLLKKMEGISNRKAKFRTVIALIVEGKEYLFEGAVSGTILKQPAGEQGFGYDPVFQPDGFAKSFAEMSLEEKNQISHRKIALRKLADFLQAL